ncbi:MAG TPA: hypothetical protein VLX92_21565 [Kofleriaceae bacterium]|nr:hypothetical protein [Kofleriaceae bacterium]
MRIGELLLGQKKLTANELARAIEEQPTAQPRRLVSLLIELGLVDFDDGSRALGEQHGVPGALLRHLAQRDPRLVKFLPAASARARCALPIGRTSRGALIVCVRDPSPELANELREAIHSDVLVAVAPASRLEQLVAEAYRPGTTVPPPGRPTPPPIPDMHALDPDSVRMALTSLDDERVARNAAATAPPPTQRGTTLPPLPPTLEQTRHVLERATTRDAATDHALAFLAGQWVSSLVLAIRERSAIVYRSHGPVALAKGEPFVVSLTSPSTVQRAVDTRRTAIQQVPGAVQDELARRLGSPSLCAAPVIVHGDPVAAIVVGEPIHALGDVERAIAELGRLAQMLAGAYERFLHRM